MSDTTSHPPRLGRFATDLGIELRTDDAGLLLARLVVGERHHNPVGRAHGAVAFTLADTVMGAELYLVDDPDGPAWVTGQMQVSYLAAVHDGPLLASARVEARTERTRIVSARVWREDDGEVVCYATATYRAAGPRR